MTDVNLETYILCGESPGDQKRCYVKWNFKNIWYRNTRPTFWSCMIESLETLVNLKKTDAIYITREDGFATYFQISFDGRLLTSTTTPLERVFGGDSYAQIRLVKEQTRNSMTRMHNCTSSNINYNNWRSFAVNKYQFIQTLMKMLNSCITPVSFTQTGKEIQEYVKFVESFNFAIPFPFNPRSRFYRRSEAMRKFICLCALTKFYKKNNLDFEVQKALQGIVVKPEILDIVRTKLLTHSDVTASFKRVIREQLIIASLGIER